jgi:hypothetical protein
LLGYPVGLSAAGKRPRLRLRTLHGRRALGNWVRRWRSLVRRRRRYGGGTDQCHFRGIHGLVSKSSEEYRKRAEACDRLAAALANNEVRNAAIPRQPMAKIQRQAGLFHLSQALDHRGIPADGEVATTSAVELRAEVERLRVLLRAMREAALSIKLGGG